MAACLSGLGFIEDVSLNNKLVQWALSIEQAASDELPAYSEGTYILAGTLGIPLPHLTCTPI